MGWLWLLVAIIIIRFLVSALVLLFWNPWFPDGLSEKIDRHLSSRLSAFGFEPAVYGDAGEDAKYRAIYQSDRFQLLFYWDRQQLFATLSPLGLSIIPEDKTLPPLDERWASSPPYSIWEMFTFVGVELETNPYELSSPRLLNTLLKELYSELSQLRPFISGDLNIYTPFRRSQEIDQLRYDWEKRKVYKDSETHEQKTIERCRRYAQAWWADGDYRSTAQVLEIIEDRLSAEETEMLNEARRRSSANA